MEFKAARNYHLPAGTFYTTWLGEILNFWMENTILLGKFQLSGRIIEIYLAEPGSYILERLSSMLVKTKIFRPEDSMLPAREKSSDSCWKMQFLMGKFQLSGRRIQINLEDYWSFVLERLGSILVATIISWPED